MPADLKGKKIGIAAFGGANQFSVLTALKAWNLPPESVQLVPSGNNLARLIAMEGGRIDATVIPNSSVGMAAKQGMTVFANIAELVKEFPDRSIIMERSYLQKERDNAKRFLRAIGEATYRIRNEPKLREKIVGSLMKRVRVDARSPTKFTMPIATCSPIRRGPGGEGCRMFWRSCKRSRNTQKPISRSTAISMRA